MSCAPLPFPCTTLYLDDDDALLDHIVDFGLDQLQQHVDALLGSALDAHSAAANGPYGLQTKSSKYEMGQLN